MGDNIIRDFNRKKQEKELEEFVKELTRYLETNEFSVKEPFTEDDNIIEGHFASKEHSDLSTVDEEMLKCSTEGPLENENADDEPGIPSFTKEYDSASLVAFAYENMKKKAQEIIEAEGNHDLQQQKEALDHLCFMFRDLLNVMLILEFISFPDRTYGLLLVEKIKREFMNDKIRDGEKGRLEDKKKAEIIRIFPEEIEDNVALDNQIEERNAKSRNDYIYDGSFLVTSACNNLKNIIQIMQQEKKPWELDTYKENLNFLFTAFKDLLDRMFEFNLISYQEMEQGRYFFEDVISEYEEND